VYMKNQLSSSRRNFLFTALGAASTVLGMLAGLKSPAARSQAATAATQNLPHLSPDDALAKALGYANSASQVDRAKYPTYKPGDACTKCRFYQGTAGQAWGPCQIFMGKSVSSQGWCASFMIKT
jgi:High potential iron-sulfur protein